jgi:putative ABC transport system permease protein
VIGYSVALRLHEIGIRAALGASASNLLRAVLTRGLVLTALGLAIGLIAALALTPLLSTVLYRVQTHDPYLLAGVAAALLLVSMFASLIPARRAAKVDPIIALHGD